MEKIKSIGSANLSSASEVARDRTQMYNALRNISRPSEKYRLP